VGDKKIHRDIDAGRIPNNMTPLSEVPLPPRGRALDGRLPTAMTPMNDGRGILSMTPLNSSSLTPPSSGEAVASALPLLPVPTPVAKQNKS
jgi:hypothetical protein